MDNLARVVHTIPRKLEIVESAASVKTLRVAAYCRVSTDDEEQLTSYEAQKLYYTQKIEGNPEWKLSGIFADEGISGLATKNRGEFNRLMALCRRGKVDLILTKSISRFARNTLDSIGWVRKLKLLSVGVYFEKENINTLTMSNEMIFTMLSAFAQAESESISENVRWGKRRAFEAGNVPFQYKQMLGYERGEDGKPQIVEAQARTVRRIFASYLAGYSVAQIKAELEADGVPTSAGKPQWSVAVLQNMLRNEKYIGDALLQKTYIADCISKKVMKNNGELPQYYVENNHPAIISREVFAHVQAELARRASKRRVAEKTNTERGKYSGKYALSELLVCGECGTAYRRVTWSRNGVKRIVWRCINRLENGKRYCETSPTLDEPKLHAAILHAMNTVLDVREEILTDLEESLSVTTSRRKSDSDFDRHTAETRLAEIELSVREISGMMRTLTNAADCDEPLTRLYDERSELLERVAEDNAHREAMVVNTARLDALKTTLRAMPMQLDEYDDSQIRAVFEQVRVTDADTLTVVLKGGYEMDAAMVCEM